MQVRRTVCWSGALSRSKRACRPERKESGGSPRLDSAEKSRRLQKQSALTVGGEDPTVGVRASKIPPAGIFAHNGYCFREVKNLSGKAHAFLDDVDTLGFFVLPGQGHGIEIHEEIADVGGVVKVQMDLAQTILERIHMNGREGSTTCLAAFFRRAYSSGCIGRKCDPGTNVWVFPFRMRVV